jgi:hypothetical protein
MAMRDFDQSVLSQSGVFKYYRFSDDIMVFTMENPNLLEQFMTSKLPGTMKFNASKSKTYELRKVEVSVRVILSTLVTSFEPPIKSDGQTAERFGLPSHQRRSIG